MSLSFYAVNQDGIMDFGKLAQDKIKTKKDPVDIESKLIIGKLYRSTTVWSNRRRSENIRSYC